MSLSITFEQAGMSAEKTSVAPFRRFYLHERNQPDNI